MVLRKVEGLERVVTRVPLSLSPSYSSLLHLAMSRRSFDEDDAELDTLLQDGRPSIKPSTSSSFTKRKSSSKGRPTRTSNWLWLISGIILAFASLALVLTAVPEDTCRTLAGTKSDKKVSTTVGSRVFFRVGGISKEGVGVRPPFPLHSLLYECTVADLCSYPFVLSPPSNVSKKASSYPKR